MKALRADGGGEFISAKLKDFCKKKNITIKYAAPYMHEENGIAERRCRMVVTTKSQRGELILEECWTGKKQDVSHVKIFGSTVSVVIQREKRHKSDVHKN